MRRIAPFLTVLSLWLLSINWSQPSQAVLAGTTTATPPTPVHYEEILQIPPVTTEYGIMSVAWVAWNPVASNFAAVYDNGHAIRILDGSTGSTTREFDFPDSTVNSIFAWSPDGKHIAALLGTPNNIIKIWALAGNSEQLPTVINRLGHDSRPIFWSPDGLRLADIQYVDYSSTGGANVLAIWDTQTGKLISSHDHMTMGAWSPDGQKMVINGGTNYGSSLQIVNPSTFKTLSTFPATLNDNTYTPYQIWTPDSRQVIGTTCNPSKCNLWIWDAQTGQVNEHFDQVDQNGVIVGDDWIANSIALNGSGTLLAAVSLNIIYLWDVQSGELLNPLKIDDQITSLSWNHAQDILVLGSRDGTIQEWRVEQAPVAGKSFQSPTESLK